MIPLIQTALTGTANHPAAQTGIDAIDTLVHAASAEQQLLLKAGALHAYQRAGWLPLQANLPPQAAPETRGEPPAQLHGVFSRLTETLFDSLRPWALQRIAEHGWRLPHAMLPAILARADVAVWSGVLGERAEWLRQQHPDWRAQSLHQQAWQDADTRLRIWQEESFAMRCKALRAQAEADAAVARQWLQADLSKEKAEQRLSLLDLWLPYAGSAEDIAWTESLLSDRSQPVRQRLASWLAQRPESSLAQRIKQRADSVLQFDSKGQLHITLPEELPRDWEKDGWNPTPPAGTGKKAWWLRQLIALIAPQQWLSAGPDHDDSWELLTTHSWSEALIAGVCDAVLRFGDVAWASASLSRLAVSHIQSNCIALFNLLPSASQTAVLLTLLQQENIDAAVRYLQILPARPAPETVQALTETLNRMLTPAFLQQLQNQQLRAQDMHALLNMLERLIPDCPDQVIADIVQLIQRLNIFSDSENWYYRSQTERTERLLTQAAFKQYLIKEIFL
ncbi:DUF5691 domain-containing protein [Undibacterium squillarum]|uniref:Uncharacterized protein n=1 Tax=Undibacterium squillarum TaxID=1131567 RepID=A0ABQ2XW31_9BURK|nr:DUF5691 domain-containing protein [Undibacterium squillarum]GGX36931.1 hypothetical protein GCM10010946_13690 [Undibacterium squillarum]